MKDIIDQKELDLWRARLQAAEPNARGALDSPVWEVVDLLLAAIDAQLKNAPKWLRLVIRLFPPIREFLASLIAKIVALVEAVKNTPDQDAG